MAEEHGTKVRYETILNNIRKEARSLRESIDKLAALRDQLVITEHPASAQILGDAVTVVNVGLIHIREVFKEI